MRPLVGWLPTHLTKNQTMNTEEMTLRDKAAFAALTGLLASPVVSEQITEAIEDAAHAALVANTATDAYAFADAMMEARKQ